jgi:hypothetical protein
MVARTRFNVMLYVHCLSRYEYYRAFECRCRCCYSECTWGVKLWKNILSQEQGHILMSLRGSSEHAIY